MKKVVIEENKGIEDEGVYYFFYYVVIWRDCEIIKLRVVYDGLVKLIGCCYILNDCFVIGFNYIL